MEPIEAEVVNTIEKDDGFIYAVLRRAVVGGIAYDWQTSHINPATKISAEKEVLSLPAIYETIVIRIPNPDQKRST